MGHAPMHWDADQYSTNSAIQYGIAMAALAEHDFNGDESVLDVGCGDGKITYQLSLQVPHGHVVGIDSSESMIQFAQKTHGARENLSFALEDVQQLGFKNEFDVAVSAFCIQWVPDKLAAFRGIRTSLKPGGKAILVMPFRNREVANLRKQMTQDAHWKKYFVDYIDPSDCVDDVQYETYAREAGFTINSYTIEATVTDFRSVKAFTDFLRVLAPHLSRLPAEEEKQMFMDELVGRYLEIVPPPQERSCKSTYVYVCAKMAVKWD
jgi:trans-aconitate 2-methyltransferase